MDWLKRYSKCIILKLKREKILKWLLLLCILLINISVEFDLPLLIQSVSGHSNKQQQNKYLNPIYFLICRHIDQPNFSQTTFWCYSYRIVEFYFGIFFCLKKYITDMCVTTNQTYMAPYQIIKYTRIDRHWCIY